MSRGRWEAVLGICADVGFKASGFWLNLLLPLLTSNIEALLRCSKIFPAATYFWCWLTKPNTRCQYLILGAFLKNVFFHWWNFVYTWFGRRRVAGGSPHQLPLWGWGGDEGLGLVVMPGVRGPPPPRAAHPPQATPIAAETGFLWAGRHPPSHPANHLTSQHVGFRSC